MTKRKMKDLTSNALSDLSDEIGPEEGAGVADTFMEGIQDCADEGLGQAAYAVSEGLEDVGFTALLGGQENVDKLEDMEEFTDFVRQVAKDEDWEAGSVMPGQTTEPVTPEDEAALEEGNDGPFIEQIEKGLLDGNPLEKKNSLVRS